MTSYTDLVQSAQDLLNTVLDDESQGNLVFVGTNGLPDLKINSPSRPQHTTDRYGHRY